MCWEDGSFDRWEQTWDTSATDTTITLYPFNGTTTQDLPMQFIHVPIEAPKIPEKKSKWMEKKQKRYDK